MTDDKFERYFEKYWGMSFNKFHMKLGKDVCVEWKSRYLHERMAEDPDEKHARTECDVRISYACYMIWIYNNETRIRFMML